MKTLAPITLAGRGTKSPRPTPPKTAPLPAPAGPRSTLRLSAKERHTLLEQFATLVDSGIQIAAALSAMRAQTTVPRLGAVLTGLEQSVVAGMPLSGAMALMPRAFPPLLTQMVRAGEATGQLGDMLVRTVESLELDAGLRHRLRSAMLYPAIMLVVTLAVVVFLLTSIVPKFESLLRGKQLPAPTELLLAAGDLLTRHGLALGVGAVIALALAWLAANTERGRIAIDAAALRLPGVAGLYRTAVLARCTRTLGLLLQAGVPLHQALEHTREVAGSEAFRRLWHRAHRSVIDGGALSDAIRRQPLLDAGFEQLVTAGEAVARLDQVMLKVAAQKTRDLERRIKDLVTVLEPMMVVMMAGVVGFVALSIMMPIFKLSRG